MRAGGFVVCVGVPPGTSVGIDLSSFTTGERFLGFKMVPANAPAPGAADGGGRGGEGVDGGAFSGAQGVGI